MEVVNIDAIKAAIAANKELNKRITKVKFYDLNRLAEDALAYIAAIRERRMCCIIKSVSRSGMCRNMDFYSFEIHGSSGYYRGYFSFFEVMGFTVTEKGVRVGGCGMDMVFHTNYTVIHRLHRLGFITDGERDVLFQETPRVL